jgi:NADH-quinone oxidoreductase subunit L
MLETLWLIPALPLIGCIILLLAGQYLPRGSVAAVGAGSVGLSAIVAILIGYSFVTSPPPNYMFQQVLYTWMDLAAFNPNIGLFLDPLSLVMVLVITFVGFLIHLFSVEYMIDDEGYARFFAYMNLFMAAMLILVLADNLLLLYLGWEGVGLCSYLLIGFWYRDPANARAAMKAFIITRIGDTAFAIGLFLLFNQFGTLQIRELLAQVPSTWPVGSAMAVLAAALVLGGALGKSAQLPLQTWLPDAMAGPTPVSALIHAATMVTAGVYLIARTNVLFTTAPQVQTAIAIIGALTLLLAAFSALAQSDIKRALAYSTISQVGYMFLALGVGAWSAALFHFVNHAFFKALLFLSAGAIIQAAHHEQNMFKMSGLRKQIPFVFLVFLLGSASLASVPLVTDGFYSKDLILFYAWSSASGGFWFWLCGIVGAFITALYSFRMVFLVFYGDETIQEAHQPGAFIRIPLAVLGILSIIFGFIELPHSFGNIQLFSNFIEYALPKTQVGPSGYSLEVTSMIIAACLTVLGILVAYWLYLKKRTIPDRLAANPLFGSIHRLWFSGWGFDFVYDRLLVQPVLWISRSNRNDVIDLLLHAPVYLCEELFRFLSATQQGRVRLYAASLIAGAVVTTAILVLL